MDISYILGLSKNLFGGAHYFYILLEFLNMLFVLYNKMLF